MKMTNRIKFKAIDKFGFETQPRPEPSSSFLPQWYRDMPPYGDPVGETLMVRNGASNATFKKCTPMLDGLVSGYIIPLWSDVQVSFINGEPMINWRTSRDVFSLHGQRSSEIEIPDGYSKTVFKYQNTWIPITPPGYSSLIISPIAYPNSPIKAITAVVDTDKACLELLPPVIIKKDFNGIINKGTPLIQIIPFKRESWKSEFEYYHDDDYRIQREKTFNSTIVSHYLKNIWSKKSYK
jgi:hypothetical protein